MSRSFFNRILRVNLTGGTIGIDEPGAAYYRSYMGGWNTIADTLLREVPAGVDPLGPQNKLVFAPGVLTGLAFSGASRNAIGAKSPLTGAFGATEVGAYWGAELKHAGFDAVIVEGVSPTPVILWIKDGSAEIRDAGHLWGKTTKETLERVQEELGDKRVRCAMIGPGGENLVSYACVMNGLKDAGGRTGMGAVMGSKRLKAVAVRGTGKVEAADPEALRELARGMATAVIAGEKATSLHRYGTGVSLDGMVLNGNLPIRNFRDGEFPGAASISADEYMGRIGTGMEGCFACAVRCKKVIETESPYRVDPAYGGPEYESVASLGSCCGVDDIGAVGKANELCNAHSLDTIGTGVAIAFAMECFENGLLTTADTDGLELRFGNGDAVIQMVSKIAYRQGLGDLLARDLDAVARQIGGGSEEYAMAVKGQAFPMHEPRFKRALAIGYALSPTGADHCHALHDVSIRSADETGFLSSGTLRGMGVLEPVPLESLGPAKVRAAVYHTVDQVMLNCLPVCLFVPWTTDEIRRLVQAATGFDVTSYELRKVGERALTLAQTFNAREGFAGQGDRLPGRSHGPTTSGALADGGIDRDELQEALQIYRGIMGWDRGTGVPTADKLYELGVGWAVAYLGVQHQKT